MIKQNLTPQKDIESAATSDAHRKNILSGRARKLGQHFLENKAAINKIIGALEIGKNETVIEIGPGEGALTIPLAKNIEAAGGKLIAIEKDQALANSAKGWGLKNFEIITGDVLEVLPRLTNYPLQTTHYKLLGNIPYYLTGFLLRTIGELENKPSLTVLTVQKEVAERIVSAPPKMNKLAASVQFWAEAEMVAVLPKSYFNPPPEVDSAIIRLTTRVLPVTNPTIYYSAVGSLFAQPRKTILNNISSHKKGEGGIERADLPKILASLGINPSDRPQNLSLTDIIRLAEAGLF